MHENDEDQVFFIVVFCYLLDLCSCDFCQTKAKKKKKTKEKTKEKAIIGKKKTTGERTDVHEADLPLSPIKNKKKRAEALQDRVEAARELEFGGASDESEVPPVKKVVDLAEMGTNIFSCQ